MLLPRRKKRKKKEKGEPRPRKSKEKKKKKRRQCYLLPRGEGKKLTWALLLIKKNSSPLNFFLILGRKYFGWLEEKIFGPHHLFFFLPTQSNTLQKSFSSHFLSKVFHIPCFISKQTHP